MTSVGRLAALPKRKAAFIEPMECAPVPKLPAAPGWLYEIKLDGYRAIAVKSGRVNLFSRRHKLFNSQYPYLVEALVELPEGTVVDGEVVDAATHESPAEDDWTTRAVPIPERGERRARLELTVSASSAMTYFPSAEACVDDLRIA